MAAPRLAFLQVLDQIRSRHTIIPATFGAPFFTKTMELTCLGAHRRALRVAYADLQEIYINTEDTRAAIRTAAPALQCPIGEANFERIHISNSSPTCFFQTSAPGLNSQTTACSAPSSCNMLCLSPCGRPISPCSPSLCCSSPHRTTRNLLQSTHWLRSRQPVSWSFAPSKQPRARRRGIATSCVTDLPLVRHVTAHRSASTWNG